MAKSLDALLDELYATAPSEFMKKRDALAKEAANKDEARTLKGRRKPTQAAYTLNQLARRNADDVADLVDAGRALARAQRKALRGEKSADLREAIERQRAVIRALTSKAGDLMRELGVATTGHLDEIAGALRAALVDPAIGDALEEGRLEKVPEPAASFAFLPVGEALPSEIDERGAEKRARERAEAERETAKERAAAEARRKRESEKARVEAERQREQTEKERRQAEVRREREAKEERARAEARAKRDAKAKASAERAERAAALRAERTRAAEEAKDVVLAHEAEADALEAKATKISEEAKRLLGEAKQLMREAATARRAGAAAKKKLSALRRSAKARAK